MSQKYIKKKNNNAESTAYGKYYASPVYDEHFIETDDIAGFIQGQASLKRSDIKGALDELGEAVKHFLELGQKVRLAGLGIFKVGFSSVGVAKAEDVSAATITTRRVIFTPETERIVVGQGKNKQGQVVQKYINAKRLVKDVVFEETYDTSMQPESQSGGGEGGNG